MSTAPASTPSASPKPALQRLARRGLSALALFTIAASLALTWFMWLRVGLGGGGWGGVLASAAPGALALAFLLLRERVYASLPPLPVAALTLALLGPLALVEAGANLIDPSGYLYFAHAQRYFTWQRYEGVLQDHCHPPNAELELRSGRVRTNAEGWRGPDYDPSPPPGTRRILALGDSVVFGWGVPEQEGVCAHLERALQARDGGPVEVINTGNGSYSSVDELLVLLDRGLDYRPHQAFVLVLANDMTDRPPYHDQVEWLADHGVEASVLEGLRAQAAPRPGASLPAGQPARAIYSSISYLLNRSYLLVSLSRPRSSLGGAVAARDTPLDSQALRELVESRYPYARSQTAALQGIVAACQRAGLPLVVFTYTYTDPDLTRYLRQALPQVRVIDLTPPADLPALVNSPTDPHWNPAGNAFFAEAMATELAPSTGDSD
jgi:hypothetical protein